LPLGFEGLVSAALSSLLGLLPVGGVTLRAALGSSLGLGVGSLAIYLLSHRLITERRGSDWLAGPLALMGALAATAAPSWTLEGSAGGGHALAAGLALATLGFANDRRSGELRRALCVGALLGATLLESRWTALGLVLALACQRLFTSALPSRRAVIAFAAGVSALLLLPLAAWLALFFSTSPASGLALGIMRSSWWPASATVEQSAALGTWLSEAGLLALALSLAGLGLGLARAALRPLLAPYTLFLALDLGLRAAHLEPTTHDPMWGVRLCSLGVLGASGAFALSTLTAWLGREKIMFARPASILLVVYGFTLVLVSAEDSARATEVRELGAAESWTDEALSSLPPNSVLLVRSQAIVFRLLAAQTTRGSRPDVLVVPFELLEHGGARAAWLAEEPGLLPLVREMLLKGQPSEYALSGLADARPTYIELDPNSDLRLTSHLLPQPFFTAFAAEPLARSDRREELTAGRSALLRVKTALKHSPDGDPATRSVLSVALAQRALLLASLGDREATSLLVDELSELDPHSSIVSALRRRLGKGKGRMDVHDLYALR
jgi:hypothetical protein